MRLEPGSEIQDTKEFWTDQLANARTMLFRVEQALHKLVKENHQSYKLDTGQTTQEVTRLEIPSLQKMKKAYSLEIMKLEKYLGVNQSSEVVVRPRW